MRNMEDYSVRLLTRLLEIYSPSGKEEEISDFLAEEMESLGFRVVKDEVGNIIGEIGHAKPVILLCGHMDTVAGQIPVQLKNNKLYGRGAVDAKASLAAMIVASSMLAKERLPNKVIVAGVVDEEGSSKGIRHLIESGSSSDYAIFGEPSGVERIIIGYKGALQLKITCRTQTGHSAAPWLFENAVEKALEILRKIKGLHLPQEKHGSRFYSITSCLIKIEGGEAISKVPSECDIHVDIRVPPQFTAKQLFNEVRKIIRQYQVANPKVSVATEIEKIIDPFDMGQDSPLVKALSWSIRKVRHTSPILLRKTGTGDMNLLGRAMEIPVVTYGPGVSRLDHTPDEHIDVQEYLDSIQVYKGAILKLLELCREKKRV